MAAEFDPYHIWLGIPPDEQPPHHYRLLGLVIFESNRAVIEAAADRQMTFLRQHGAGDHGDASQKLLNEVSKALVELLNPTRKAAYDQRLRAIIDAQDDEGEAASPAAVEFSEWEEDAHSVSVADVGMRRRPMSVGLKAALAGFVFVLLGAGLGTYPLWGSTEVQENGSVELNVTARKGAAILVDGQPIDTDRLASPVPLTAGRHMVELKREKALLATSTFWIVPGSATTVSLVEPEPRKPDPKTVVEEAAVPPSNVAATSPAEKPPVEVASVDPRNASRPPNDLPVEDARPATTSKPKAELAGKDGDDPKPDKSESMKPETEGSKSGKGPKGEVVKLTERRRLKGAAPITSMTFSEDGNLLASYHFASGRGDVRIWNTGTGKAERNTLSLPATNNFQPQPLFATDSKLFYISGGPSQQSNLMSWQWKTNRSLTVGVVGQPSGSRPARVSTWALSNDEQMAVLALRPHNDNAPRVVGFSYWNPKTKKELRYAPENGADFIDHLALTPDGEIAAASFHNYGTSRKDLEASVRIWGTKSKEVLYTERFDRATLRCEGLRFIDGGRKLIYMGPGLTEFSVIEIGSAKKTSYTVSLLGGDPGAALFLPNSLYGITRMRTGRGSSELYVFGLEEGRILSYPNANEPGVESLQLSPNGALLATGDKEGEIILWDVERP